MDSNGNRLKDAEGNLKTLRHKFAAYCDDICAGADSLEELYELFEALICCYKRAGIQVKTSKTKFGVEKVTFHNYTITREGTQPKDASLCPIRNMTSLSDVSQVRAFLGCCQQMSQFIKGYGITAAPLHGLTKKHGPSPSRGSKARIMISLSNPLGLQSLIRGTSYITKIAMRGYSSRWMRAIQDEVHAPTKWSSDGMETRQTKVGVGKEIPEPERSLSGSARHGRHSS
jgi:hypothetical protein